MQLYLYVVTMQLYISLKFTQTRSDSTAHTCTHLWSYQGEYLGKDHMTDESEKDMIAECREPHHPFEVRHIL